MSRTLLTTPTACGYPLEYLVPRIRSRRQEGGLRRLLPVEVAFPPYDDREIEQVAMEERRWLYRQMDDSTRAKLLPVFVYSELSRLFTLLRLFEGEHEIGSALCEKTLLNDDITTLYRTMESPHAFLGYVNGLLTPYLRHDCHLALCYAQTGLAHAEEVMVENLLSWGAQNAEAPLVRGYFRHLIDHYNGNKLRKWQRWQLTAPCTFVAGGHSPCSRWNRILQSGTQPTPSLIAGAEETDSAPLASAPADPLRHLLVAQARQQDGLAELLLYLEHIDWQQVELRQGTWQRPPLLSASHQVRT